MKPCKDCFPDGHGAKSSMVGKAKPRPAPYPGPRCATHHREKRKTDKARNHGTYLQRTYNMTADTYDALLAYQGGVCYICRRANGATRKLSVDHDHKCCDKPPTCGECTRGLLCRPCNDMLGHLRDNVGTAMRVAMYLLVPPTRRMEAE